MTECLPKDKKLSILLSFIWRNPSYSLDRILAELPERKGKKIFSRSGIQKTLTKLGLNTAKKRRAWARRIASAEAAEKFAELAVRKIPRKLTPEDRLEMIRLVEREEMPVTRAVQAYGISRKNFYKWKKRYQASVPGKEYQAVCDQKPIIERRWNQLTDKQVEAILEIVRKHPEYSTHKVAQILAEVGNHGVQNVFQRLNLNTYEKRLTYAEAYRPIVTLVTRMLERAKPIWGKIPVISAIPPPTREKIASLTRPFVFSLLSSVTFSTIFIYWLRIIAQAPTLGAKLGLFFASTALLIGSFFFAYSMKYYLTLAIVLSFSRQPLEEGGGFAVGLNGRINNNQKNGNGWLARIFGLGSGNGERREMIQAGGLQPSLDHIKLKRYPFVSIHLPFYNEKKVAERILKACTAMDYPNYEIIVIDDSTDETTEIVKRFAKKHNQKHPHGPKIKVLHRPTRKGFKGGALAYALKHMSPKAEFVVVLDADFIPYPDTLELFIKYFKANNPSTSSGQASSEDYKKSNIAVVGGYQWHVLNKSENWITRGVRTEYAGSYVIERPGREILGLIKQISGSVYMIRADLLKKIGWGTSITEDFQLTLKLYEQGYKVIYTPYIQGPAECASTLKRLIRQRMRWAEGHSNNIKRMFFRLMSSPKLTLLEKLEIFYLSPYYLQAAFFMVGTFSWLLAETVFRTRLPFWTSLWGWSLVLTNFFSLPLMNAVGLFLEESEEKDYFGIISFIALSYILVPFQAYASVKGFLEKEEGPWFRTPKTGKITDIFTRGRFYRWISGILPGGRSTIAASLRPPRVAPAYLSTPRHNPYLARATANSQFNNFRITRNKVRYLGRIVVSLVVIVSLSLNFLAKLVPTGSAPGGWMRVTVRPGEENIASQAKVLNLTAEKSDFRSDEQPRFWLKIEPEREEENKISLVQEARAADQVKTEVFYAGRKVNIPVKVEEDNEGNLALSLFPQREFKPGKYLLKASFSEDGVEYQGTQDFTWGVLAINTDKSIYLPNEEAFIGMAVLDNQGKMVCDAQVSLEITDPNGQKTSLTTENGEIKISEECDYYGVTNLPDYYTFYQVGKAGDYQMRLIAQTANGERVINDSFEVREWVPFEVKRTGPTRIYPPETYEMQLSIKANKDFVGQVIEKMPGSFRVKSKTHTSFEMQPFEGLQEIIWKVDWKKGERYELSYEFDVPKESPMFYLLGPLRFTDVRSGQTIFQEARQWQIAADYDYDVTYSFTTQAGANDGTWTYWNTDIGYHSVAVRDTDQYWCWTDTGSPSTSTGPPTGVACIYPETSSPSAAGDVYTAELTTALDASQYGFFVTFNRCMYGDVAGYMYFEAYDGTGWNTIASWNGDGTQAFTATGPYDFSPTGYNYTNTDFNIRFRVVIGGTAYNNDFTFDEVHIYGDLKNSAPNAPTLSKLFDNERTADNTPAFEFSSTDPDADDIEYQIEIDDDYNFGTINVTANSETPDPGFENVTTPADTHPFNSGDTIRYTVQAGDALSNGTYWWRVKAKDPGGTNTWSSYSAKRSFTVNTGMAGYPSEWFQTTDEQFATDTLSETETTGSDSVQVKGW